MKASVLPTGLSVFLAAAGFVAAVPMLKAEQPSTADTAVVVDVALQPGDVMLGQLADAQGQALEGREVALFLAGRFLATATSDQRGGFSFRGLQGGVYQITAAGGWGLFRVWSPGTAPPAAPHAALVVAGQSPLRGQSPSCTAAPAGCNPLTGMGPYLAGLIGGAVAIPLGIGELDAGPSGRYLGDDYGTGGETPTSP